MNRGVIFIDTALFEHLGIKTASAAVFHIRFLYKICDHPSLDLTSRLRMSLVLNRSDYCNNFLLAFLRALRGFCNMLKLRRHASYLDLFGSSSSSSLGRLFSRYHRCLVCSTNCYFGVECQLSNAYRKLSGLCVCCTKLSSVKACVLFVIVRRDRLRNIQ